MNSIKIKYFIILTFFIIISCDDEKEVNVIEKGKMAKILLEMHLSEESIDMLKFKKDTLNALFSEKEKEIFEKHSITEKEYRESYSYYFFNPQELEQIYEELIDSLLLYQQTFQNEKIQ
ncbi:MAG: DUF4296 domain-containing protein [Cytophagales bacterium]|jgi:hypothetical protein|nr:DUF4296 domain-containing protein [Cytophagales bacterium]|tara:strand:- start:881 stop:1237 length:357 start_codon:yes stop_codon:yes gene_type:complete